MITSTAPVARAGSRRFWITVLLFLIANVLAWIAYDRFWQYRHRGLLHVYSFEPGDGASVDPRQTMCWDFDADVIPTSLYGRDPGTVTPAVRGHWAWGSPRSLVFIPDADLPRATAVTFTLSDALLRSTTGARLSSPYTTTVKVAPLSLNSVQQVGVLDNDRYILELSFTDRVAPGEVLKHLALTRDGRSVGCQLFGQTVGTIVRVRTDSLPPSDKADTVVNVHLSYGLVGLSGPLGTVGGLDYPVTFTRALMATGIRAEAPMSRDPFLELNFNNEVDSGAIKEVLSVAPSVDFTTEYRGSTVLLRGPFASGTRYTVTLAAPPAGADLNRYPHAGALAAFIPDREAGLWFDSSEGYLSAQGNRTVLARAMNIPGLRVSVFRVYDNNLVAWHNQRDGVAQYGPSIAERTIPIEMVKNKQVDVPIRLNDLLPESASRDGVYEITAVAVDPKDPSKQFSRPDGANYSYRYESYYENNSATTVVTLSDIALSARQSKTGLLAWATSLRTARPMPGVRVRVYSNKNQLLGEATSDASGLARVSGMNPADGESSAVLLADCVSPVAAAITPTTEPATQLATTEPATVPTTIALTWLDLNRSAVHEGDGDISGAAYIRGTHEAFLYTDRGVYRPGETVRLRAIVRGPDNAPPAASFPVRWLICRPDMHDWKEQIVTLDADGAAALDLPLPTDLTPGQWTAYLSLPGDSAKGGTRFGQATFLVEEFVPNRLKVKLALPSGISRYAVGSPPLHADVQADYLFGRPAAELNVSLSTNLVPTSFRPHEWEHYDFGDSAGVLAVGNPATPVSIFHALRARHSARPSDKPTDQTLDDAGHLDWSLNVTSIVPATTQPAEQFRGPWRLAASAGVHEVGGRTVTATQQIDVDVLPAYIGIDRESLAAPRPGDALPIRLNLVRPDGKLLTNSTALQATLYQESWNTNFSFIDGRYRYDSHRILDVVRCDNVAVTAGQLTWMATPPSNGDYVIAVRDLKTGAISSAEFVASDGSPWDDNVNRDNPERLTVRILAPGEQGDSPEVDMPGEIRPEPRKFGIGETANVLIASPFPGQCLLTIETDDVLETRVIDMPKSHMVVPIKVTGSMRPNAFICASVIRPIDPDAKWRVHRAYGVTRLRVDPADRQLDIAIDAPKLIQPHESLDVGLTVTDADGEPVENAAVTVAAVDEGICALTDFKTPDPLAFFNADRALSVNGFDVFALLMPEIPRQSAVGGDGSKADAFMPVPTSPVTAQRVKPVALAWVSAHTDADGHARASFPVPEFQGRLRIMAVAYQAENFGSADQDVTVRSPILAQTSWPRFAAPGDRFVVPIVLFNNTASNGEAVVSMDCQNDGPAILALGTAHADRVELPAVTLNAGGQRTLEIPVRVNQSTGVARVHLHVAMNDQIYDENLELPVRPPAPLMRYSGATVASTTQPTTLDPPVAMLPGTRSLQVSITPWPTLQIPAGFDYLDRYPYGCVEQTTSTCFPLITLGEIGKQLDPVRFAPERMKYKIDLGILRLVGMQTADGGLAMWTGQTDTWEWGTIYAAHFLTEAKAAGYDVPDEFYKTVIAHLRHQLDVSSDDPEILERQAYAGFVLALAGQSDRAILNRLTELASAPARSDEENRGVAMRSDSRLMLACAWMLSGRRDLAEKLIPQVLPTPRIAREYDGNIGSPIRDRAMLIYALAMVNPNHPALPMLVQQLADDGALGRWASTQDTSFAMMAIARYLRAGAQHKPYDTARLMLGEKVLAEASAGESMALDVSSEDIYPSSTTQPAAVLSVRATGKPDAVAHVSWLQVGVPLAPPPDAEHGMTINRRYLAPDGTELKSNAIRSGDLIRVEITVQADPKLRNIVIEDLLPAGLEAENPRLLTSDPSAGRGNPSADENLLADHRLEIRDDRVILLGSMNSSGIARCQYVARAVTPGTFVLPPVRVEAMYDIGLNAINDGGGKFTVIPADASFAWTWDAVDPKQ